jgi:hypothetical protein
MDRVVVRVPDPVGILAGYGTGAVLKVQRSFDPDDFTGAADLADIAVVADAFLYTVWDTSNTTAWYRWRAENAIGTQLGEWSDPFQGTDPAIAAHDDYAYANVDDLLLALPQPPPDLDGRKAARIHQALVQARERLDGELDVSFARSPQTGTEARYFDGPGGCTLHVHGGIVSLATVEIRASIASDWETVDAEDWRLLPENPIGGQPYFHLELLGVVANSTWPRGSRLVRVTGAFNWAHPPQRAIAANVALARQALAADPTFAGGVVGPPQLGAPVGPNRLPEDVWRLKRWHVELFMGCRV